MSPFYFLVKGYKGGDILGGIARSIPRATIGGTVVALAAGFARIQSYENKEEAIADRAFRLKVPPPHPLYLTR